MKQTISTLSSFHQQSSQSKNKISECNIIVFTYSMYLCKYLIISLATSAFTNAAKKKIHVRQLSDICLVRLWGDAPGNVSMYSTYSRYALNISHDVIFSQVKLMIQTEGWEELSEQEQRDFQAHCTRKAFLWMMKQMFYHWHATVCLTLK